ncbi:unnamed protein product [Sphagnum balticum]
MPAGSLGEEEGRLRDPCGKRGMPAGSLETKRDACGIPVDEEGCLWDPCGRRGMPGKSRGMPEGCLEEEGMPAGCHRWR